MYISFEPVKLSSWTIESIAIECDPNVFNPSPFPLLKNYCRPMPYFLGIFKFFWLIMDICTYIILKNQSSNLFRGWDIREGWGAELIPPPMPHTKDMGLVRKGLSLKSTFSIISWTIVANIIEQKVDQMEVYQITCHH